MTTMQLDEALRLLTKICESDVPLKAETRMIDTALDSLDVLEFMFEAGIDSDEALDDEEFIENMESLTLGEIYRALVS